MKNLWQKEHFNLLKNTSAQIYMAKCVNINISNKLCTLVYNKYWSIDIFLIILINTCRYAWIFFAKKILYLWNNPKCGLIKKKTKKKNYNLNILYMLPLPTCDRWHRTYDTWHVTPDTGHLRLDTWHMKPDTWHQTCESWWKIQFIYIFCCLIFLSMLLSAHVERFSVPVCKNFDKI